MASEDPNPTEASPNNLHYEKNILQYFWAPLLRFKKSDFTYQGVQVRALWKTSNNRCQWKSLRTNPGTKRDQ